MRARRLSSRHVQVACGYRFKVYIARLRLLASIDWLCSKSGQLGPVS